MKSLALAAGLATLLVLGSGIVLAQNPDKIDPAKNDPAHFKVELDNSRVRVLHVTVAPNTKVELHDVDDAVVVPLTDYESTLKRPNGETAVVERKTGKPAWVAAGAREFEAGAKGVDALLIELKPPAGPHLP
jgi:hypothetical protein